MQAVHPFTLHRIIQPYLLNGDIEDHLKHDALNLHEFAYHTASQSV